MKRDEIDEEDIATPGTDHVEISNTTKTCPVDVARLDALDPEIVGEEHAKDGDGFIVITTSDTPGDISGDNRDHPSSTETCPGRVEFAGEQISYHRSKRGESRCEEHTDFSHIDRDIDSIEDVIEEAGSDHEARIDGTTDDPTQGVPSSIVEPIVKVIEAVLGEVFCSAIIEIWIKFMDDRLESKNREESG